MPAAVRPPSPETPPRLTPSMRQERRADQLPALDLRRQLREGGARAPQPRLPAERMRRRARAGPLRREGQRRVMWGGTDPPEALTTQGGQRELVEISRKRSTPGRPLQTLTLHRWELETLAPLTLPTRRQSGSTLVSIAQNTTRIRMSGVGTCRVPTRITLARATRWT